MKRLFIKDFKAFSDDVDIDLSNEENLLIYGENGAGKSSIYEAIKFFFFKNDIEKKTIPISILNSTGAQAEKDTLRNSFNNKIGNNNFQLKINDEELDILISNAKYDEFISKYDILMISKVELSTQKEINIEKLITSAYCSINNLPFTLSPSESEELEFEINLNLEAFLEKIRIEINSTNNCSLIDETRNLNISSDFFLYFNEAKLNIILLLLYFNLFKLKTKESSNKRILVLDDIVTSLDFANRTFLIKYIYENFSTENDQIILLTHNTSFYNLLCHYLRKFTMANNGRKHIHLYEIDNRHKYYDLKESLTVSDIEQQLQSTSSNIEEIGNLLRKKFESLVHQFAMLFSVGLLEENNTLLDQLCTSDHFYYNKVSNTNVNKLIEDIEVTLKSANQDSLNNRIQKKINGYKIDQAHISFMKDSLKNLKLYQKTTMHSLSHYQGGVTTNFTQKEIEMSILLMKKLESNLLKLKKQSQEPVIENL